MKLPLIIFALFGHGDITMNNPWRELRVFCDRLSLSLSLHPSLYIHYLAARWVKSKKKRKKEKKEEEEKKTRLLSVEEVSSRCNTINNATCIADRALGSVVRSSVPTLPRNSFDCRPNSHARPSKSTTKVASSSSPGNFF